ncbi:MAG: 16S rRNA (cytosine(1402)-N(4))-methyltransferase RsmH [Clostridia bacterium]|nr:16S rRNA (cytosine(1402)-N(4))-methyltransferase RsmH [Clostridia bacterium]
MEFNHISVMLNECIDALNIKPNGTYMDGTLGGGGHSSIIASKLNERGTLVCFDLDTEAIEFAKTRVKSTGNLIFAHQNFKNFLSVLQENNITGLDGILVDLGVSSYQIDNPERGFSYMQDGPLNMCMDKSASLNAEFVVNEYTEQKLTEIFFKYGEEKFSRSIARGIVNARKINPIKTTLQLVDIIEKNIPTKARFANGHPAKRIFQAIRIEVNGELSNLKEFLFDCVRKGLNKGGRLAVITFHSLEDKIVKDAFKELSTDCLCDKKLPVCICHHQAEIKLINKKPILPSQQELQSNSRSHSAKLRIIEKL